MTYNNWQKIVDVGETGFLPYAAQAAQEESESELESECNAQIGK
jgi:hypothetical protein